MASTVGRPLYEDEEEEGLTGTLARAGQGLASLGKAYGEADRALGRTINSFLPRPVIPFTQEPEAAPEAAPEAPAPAAAPVIEPPQFGDPLSAHRQLLEQQQGDAAALAKAAQSIGPDVVSERRVQSKDAKAAATALDQSLQEQRTAAGATTKVKVDAATTEAEGATADVAAVKEVNEQAAVRRQRERTAFDEGIKLLDAQRKEVMDKNLTSFWEDRSTGSLVASALMVGLGQFAAAYTGGVNGAMQVIDKAVERDIAQKRQKIAAELERQGVAREDMRRRMELAEIELQNQKAGLMDRLAAERIEREKRHGADAARAEGSAVAAALGQRAAEIKLANAQRYEAVVKSDNSRANQIKLAALQQAATGGDVPASERMKSEGMRNATRFYLGAVNAYDNYSKKSYSAKDEKVLMDIYADMRGDKTFDSVDKLRALRERLNPKISRLSAEGQAKFLSGLAFTNMTLRDESGAAIGDRETLLKQMSTLVSPGTSEEARRQTTAAAINDLAGLGMRAGIPATAMRDLTRRFIAPLNMRRLPDGRIEVPDDLVMGR